MNPIILEKIYLVNIWNLIVDIGYAMAGIGILVALYRRLIVRPEKLKGASMEGVLILFAILGIVLTAFIVEAGYMVGENAYNNWEPIVFALPGLLYSTRINCRNNRFHKTRMRKPESIFKNNTLYISFYSVIISVFFSIKITNDISINQG